MPAVVRNHRLLILAFAVGVAALLAAAVIAGVLDDNHARAAFAAVLRSSWG